MVGNVHIQGANDRKKYTTIQDAFALAKFMIRLPLCEEHHKIAHAGLIENERVDADDWKLRDEPTNYVIDEKVRERWR